MPGCVFAAALFQAAAETNYLRPQVPRFGRSLGSAFLLGRQFRFALVELHLAERELP